MDRTRENNVQRFSGFSDLYDRSRPSPPALVTRILTAYLQRTPGVVLDLGSGTGLSTLVWATQAHQVIGIEPNPDMRHQAEVHLAERGSPQNVSFQAGYSNPLQFPSEHADIITCSQSFHWMEPVTTIQEAGRVLRSGGIFATYDCDWPPTVSWPLERLYQDLMDHADRLIAEHLPPDRQVRRWDKNHHLSQIQQSGLFRFAKEIVFHDVQKWTGERLYELTLSQGGLQTVLRTHLADLSEELQEFSHAIADYFNGRAQEVILSYRMRIGVK